MKTIMEASGNVLSDMKDILNEEQLRALNESLSKRLSGCIALDPSKACDTLGKSYLVLDKFLENKATYKASEKTLQVYKNCIFNFIKYIEQPLALITSDHIGLYLQYKQRTSSLVYVENIRLYLSSFFGWCYDYKYIAYNPCTKNLVPPIKLPETLRHDITELDLLNIKEAATKIDKPLARYRAIALIEFLESTGCRVNEVSCLKIEDLDLKRNRAKILGKGSKERYVFLTISAKKKLQEYLDYKMENDMWSPYVFSNLRKPYLDKKADTRQFELLTKKLGEQCDISDLTVHIFRRYFATTAVRKGMKPDTLRALMGHSNYQTTLGYISQSSDDLYIQFMNSH